MAAQQSDETKFALIQQQMSYMTKQLDTIDNKVSTHYVTREEFEPIKKIVYGLVGLILVAVVGAVVSLVLK